MPKQYVIFIIAIVALLALGGVAAYVGLKPKGVEHGMRQELRSVATLPEPSLEIDTSNWQTYRNDEYGFEVKFPSQYIAVLDTYLPIFFDPKYRVMQGEGPFIRIGMTDLQYFKNWTFDQLLHQDITAYGKVALKKYGPLEITEMFTDQGVRVVKHKTHIRDGISSSQYFIPTPNVRYVLIMLISLTSRVVEDEELLRSISRSESALLERIADTMVRTIHFGVSGR